jgi:hypothetical protein
MFKVYKYLYIPRFHSEDAVDLVSHGVGSVVDAVDNVWGQKKTLIYVAKTGDSAARVGV